RAEQGVPAGTARHADRPDHARRRVRPGGARAVRGDAAAPPRRRAAAERPGDRPARGDARPRLPTRDWVSTMNEQATVPDPADDPEDVVALLMRQHGDIRNLFDEVEQSTGDQRKDAFARLVRLLAVHETAEEEVV